MPGGKLHAAATRRVLGVSGIEVQRLMDSTARLHGPAHRRDHVHSVNGVVIELARRGQLTPQAPAVAALHRLLDETMSPIYRHVLPKGPLRRPAQELLENILVQALEPKRRR